MQQAFVQMSNPDYQPPAPRECHLDQADHLQRFIRLQPGQFDGRPEALTAIAWLREMERHFRALGTPVEFWAIFAVTRLTGSAIRWWEIVERMQDTFHTLPEIAVAAQRAEAIEESLDSRRKQRRGNDRKATRRNQGQWSSQGTPSSDSSNSSGFSGGGRGSPYGGCFVCGQQGHRKKECPNRLQKSPLSQEGPQRSQSGSASYQSTQARPQQSQGSSQKLDKFGLNDDNCLDVDKIFKLAYVKETLHFTFESGNVTTENSRP
ncbi:Zinc finger, CCHC-type [Parasponia andersonii]|uniref:Zinc finger, CCHC-type n=1 Tax=Parasponia andersonii TaxID=3476 RepID=A0A2P5CU09_PARAD|nr:Zinc finger, CCHC-type [Parasponia andersonii]